jgi:hypothetical protein
VVHSNIVLYLLLLTVRLVDHLLTSALIIHTHLTSEIHPYTQRRPGDAEECPGIPRGEEVEMSSSAGYEPLGQHPDYSSSSLRRSGGPLHLLITHVPPLLAALLCTVALVFSILPPTGPAALGESDPWLRSIKPLPASARNTLALSESVCAKEFPLLYPQLEELKQHWKRRGGISKSDVDELERAASGQNNWGWARVIIRDGKVYIRSLRKGVDTRLTATLMLLHDAVSADPGSSAPGSGEEPLPPIDLILSVGDKEGFPGAESGPAWVLTKLMADTKSQGNWLSPDFGFAGWPEARVPSYSEVVDLNRQVEQEVGGWAGKDDRAFWRGFVNWYPIRHDLIDRTKAASALPASHPDAWADVFQTTFGAQDSAEYKPLVALQDHCSRKYLIHSEGNSYSGRSRYLFSCHSVTIAHKMEWTQHFHPALVSDPLSPAQNYVQVTGPLFEGLEEVVRGMWEGDGDPKAKGVEGWWHKASQKDMVGFLPPEKIADNARDSLRDRE